MTWGDVQYMWGVSCVGTKDEPGSASLLDVQTFSSAAAFALTQKPNLKEFWEPLLEADEPPVLS